MRIEVFSNLIFYVIYFINLDKRIPESYRHFVSF